MIPVKVIQESAKTALVECVIDGAYSRVFILASEIRDGNCNVDTLNAGIKYGLDWKRVVEKVLSQLDAASIANELKRHSIYRGDELTNNLQNARKAIWQGVGAPILQELINLSKLDKEE